MSLQPSSKNPLSKLDGYLPLHLSHHTIRPPVGKEDLRKESEKKSRNSNKDISQESDSFYKYYNKEIKVNQDEIPIVLSELIDASFNYIQKESYEKALILLQKTEGVLEVVNLEHSRRDKYVVFTTFHNMALCYQKLGMLEECFIYLKECLSLISSPTFYKEGTIASRMKQLKQECKLKLQLCAILSQTQNHSEALEQSKKSVKLAHQLFKDLTSLCLMYIKKIDHKESSKLKKPQTEEGEGAPISEASSPSNFLEDSISMVERTALKLYPIVLEVMKRMVQETPSTQHQHSTTQNILQNSEDIRYAKIILGDNDDADMRSVLGFLNQNEWICHLNIGNIMQMQPLNVRDMLACQRNETELARDSFLEKISLLAVSYFCVSTEQRFLLQSREQYLTTPVKKTRELESEFWHAKALEIACTFLPSECPLLNHVLLSYQKHHDPTQQAIKEDQEQTDVLNVLRPLNGIESNKYQPIIRQLQNIKVVISPFPMSPLTNKAKVKTRVTVTPIANFDKGIGTDSMDYPLQQEPKVENEYADDYCDRMIKNLIDDPKVDKKTLVTKLLSHFQSQDLTDLQKHLGVAQLDQNESQQELEGNKSFDQIPLIIDQNLDNSQNRHLWSQQQQSRKLAEQPKKKRKETQRVQKMMSYLEGDSLLREIEKSLEQDVENDDDVLIEASDIEGECIAVEISSKEPSSSKNKNLASQGKSSSFTRPSSSITNYTASSQLRKRKRKAQNQTTVNQQIMTSQNRVKSVSSDSASKSSQRIKFNAKQNHTNSGNSHSRSVRTNEQILKKQRTVQESATQDVKPHHTHLKSQMGSRLSNLFSTNNKTMKNSGKRVTTNRRQSRSSAKEDSASRSRYSKAREVSADRDSSAAKDSRSNRRSPFLTQPSENVNHTYSFDTAFPQSQKNVVKNPQQQITTLQQQVLENQKAIMRLQTNNSDSKPKKKASYGNLRQSGVISNFNQASEGKKGNLRSKSTALRKGVTNLLSKINQKSAFDSHSRQSIAPLQNNKGIQKSIGNKENVSSKVGSNNQRSKKNSSVLGIQGLPANQRTGLKLQKEIEFLKSKMKEHFKFFSNHSPQLKRKRKSGSHSPPIKQQSQSRQPKIEKSRGKAKAGNGASQIFATADNRLNTNQKRQHTTENDLEDPSWLANDQSFDAFIRTTLGGNEDPKTVAMENEFERPSLGGGIHRGSSDVMMFNNGIAQNTYNTHNLSYNAPISATQPPQQLVGTEFNMVELSSQGVPIKTKSGVKSMSQLKKKSSEGSALIKSSYDQLSKKLSNLRA